MLQIAPKIPQQSSFYDISQFFSNSLNYVAVVTLMDNYKKRGAACLGIKSPSL